MRIRMYACVALAVVPAVTYAQKVNVDSDPSARFAMYKTYAWTTGAPSLVSLNEQRIHVGVDAQLQANGLRLAESDPDLYVASFVLTRSEPQIIANGFAPWGFGGGVVSVEQYVQGTFIIDLYDAAKRKMVWRGVAVDTASNKPLKNTEKIDKAVAKMFERYPSPMTSSSR